MGAPVQIGHVLCSRHGLGAPLVTTILEDTDTGGYAATARAFEAHFGWALTPADCAICCFVAEAVVVRAGRLVAAGLVTATGRLAAERKGCAVAFDGSVFEKMPVFRAAMEGALVELCGPEHGIRTFSVQDASGKGAALMAALQTSKAV